MQLFKNIFQDLRYPPYAKDSPFFHKQFSCGM